MTGLVRALLPAAISVVVRAVKLDPRPLHSSLLQDNDATEETTSTTTVAASDVSSADVTTTTTTTTTVAPVQTFPAAQSPIEVTTSTDSPVTLPAETTYAPTEPVETTEEPTDAPTTASTTTTTEATTTGSATTAPAVAVAAAADAPAVSDTTTTAPPESDTATTAPTVAAVAGAVADPSASAPPSSSSSAPAANVSTISAIHRSLLHPTLVFPFAKAIPIPQQNGSDFVSTYCESRSNTLFAPPPSVGTRSQRYRSAVLEQLALLRPTTLSLMQRKSGSIQFHASMLQLHPASSSLYGPTCSEDVDCSSLGRRAYCIEGLCRECAPVSQTSDCPNSPSGDMCSAETGYTCSECVSDSGCDGIGGSCRFIFPEINSVPMMPRKLCTNCAGVPLTAEIFNASICAWRCPFGTSLSADESECITSPQCSAAQFLAPASDDSLFFTPGVNTTDPECKDCATLGPVNSPDFCAVLVKPDAGGPVGNLNKGKNVSEYLPCNSFTCKAGWALNDDHTQCAECNYGSCQYGTYLQGCGGDQAGECIACSRDSVTVNSTWIDLTLVDINVTDAQITCASVCKDGFYRTSSRGACLSCAEAEKKICRPGSTLEDCGPGTDTGACTPCPNLTPGNYWTGDKCYQASCSARNEMCTPGEVLTGCGGESAGDCQPCPGGLPQRASAWTSGCDFMCSTGSFIDREQRKCIQCNSALQCTPGTVLTGCGLDGVVNGTCAPCDGIGMGQFFTGNQGCTPSRCDATICEETELLVGCGYGYPGHCESCGPVPTGIHFFSRDVSVQDVRQCIPSCQDGYEIIKDETGSMMCQFVQDDDSDSLFGV